MFATEYQKLGRGLGTMGDTCVMSDVGKPTASALTVLNHGTGTTAQDKAREHRKLVPQSVLLELRRGLRWVEASEQTLASDYMTGSGKRHDAVMELIKPRLPYPMASCVPKLEPQLWGNEERLGKLMALKQLDLEMARDPGKIWPKDIERAKEIERLEAELVRLGQETQEIRTVRVPKKCNPELEEHDPGMMDALTGSNMHPSSQWKSSYASASSPDLLYAYDKKAAERRLVPARKFSKHTKRREERRIYDYSLVAAVVPEATKSVLNGWEEASSVVTKKLLLKASCMDPSRAAAAAQYAAQQQQQQQEQAARMVAAAQQQQQQQQQQAALVAANKSRLAAILQQATAGGQPLTPAQMQGLIARVQQQQQQQQQRFQGAQSAAPSGQHLPAAGAAALLAAQHQRQQAMAARNTGGASLLEQQARANASRMAQQQAQQKVLLQQQQQRAASLAAARNHETTQAQMELQALRGRIQQAHSSYTQAVKKREQAKAQIDSYEAEATSLHAKIMEDPRMKQDTETRNLFLKQCMDRIQKMKEYRNQYTALMEQAEKESQAYHKQVEQLSQEFKAKQVTLLRLVQGQRQQQQQQAAAAAAAASPAAGAGHTPGQVTPSPSSCSAPSPAASVASLRQPVQTPLLQQQQQQQQQPTAAQKQAMQQGYQVIGQETPAAAAAMARPKTRAEQQESIRQLQQAREVVYVLESFATLILSHRHMIKLSYRNRLETERLHSWARSVRDLVEGLVSSMNTEYSGRMVVNADQLRFLSRSSKGRGNEGVGDTENPISVDDERLIRLKTVLTEAVIVYTRCMRSLMERAVNSESGPHVTDRELGPSISTVCCALGAALGVAPPTLSEISRDSTALYELILSTDTYMASYRPFKFISQIDDEQFIGTSITEESLPVLTHMFGGSKRKRAAALAEGASDSQQTSDPSAPVGTVAGDGVVDMGWWRPTRCHTRARAKRRRRDAAATAAAATASVESVDS
ncbi:hypothetical protein FOL47_001275 [Perkinsus chesapeaki]|uniref:Uncharacterized protein n=1 Tax=Perkinsus chesapeaki TaxID=330153 RepID=A0A7J6N217_PERCH|nr:hypothetical protein FOL47_001275 [Perkinsus chesapeaki]